MNRVGMVSGPSRLDDASFLFSAWSGLTQARTELGIKTTILEAAEEGDLDSNMDYLTYDGYELIWAVGYNTQEVVERAAARNPTTHFCTVDVAFEETPPNVTSVVFDEHHGAFLAGYAAAKLSESGAVGFVGGEECELISKFAAGFAAGALHANPEIDVKVDYAGSFIKYNAGRVVAERLLGAGCDILFHAAGSAGKGAIRVAKDRGKYIIGVDCDQAFLAPGNVITSMLKRVDQSVLALTRDLYHGVTPNPVRRFGLADDAIALTPIMHPAAGAELEHDLAAVRSGIVNGSIEVPSA